MNLDLSHFPAYEIIPLSTYFQEKIVNLFFNLTRKHDSFLIYLIGKEFREVLLLFKQELVQNRRNGFSDSEYKFIGELDLLYRLVVHTRDIIGGKGEHELFYMLIYELYKVFPTLSVYLLHHYIDLGIGCWRDMKYLCQYVLEDSKNDSDSHNSLIELCIRLMNRQLKRDIDMDLNNQLSNISNISIISNICKWIPREKKKFGWVFEKLVLDWSATYGRWKLDTVTTIHGYNSPQYIAGLVKCRTQYRKMLSTLNRTIDTTEIKLCAGMKDDIDIRRVSKYTIMKQPRVFHLDSSSRTIGTLEKGCSSDFTTTMIQLPISYFVKEAYRIIESELADTCKSREQEILHKKWLQYSSYYRTYDFVNMLPILDISYKMLESDAEVFYTAVGLSILISQQSTIGKRIFAMENNPTWININVDNHMSDFLSMVKVFYEKVESQRNTAFSFERSIDLLLKAIHETNDLSKNMKFVFFSNRFTGDTMNTYYKYLIQQCGVLDIRNIPRLFFWNLSKTSVFDSPNEKVLSQCGLVSGFSSMSLKAISQFKMGYNNSAFSLISTILLSKRYDPFSNYLRKLLV